MTYILKRGLFLFFMFSMLTVDSYSQEEELVPFRNSEISINATQFIESLLSFNNTSLAEQNASSILFKTGNGKLYFRSGLSLDHSSTKEDNSTLTNSLIGIRIGVERKSHIGKKWALNSGGGVLVNTFGTKTKVDDPFFPSFEFSENTLQTGLEGVLGIQFFVSERIALSTESYFLASISSTKFKQDGADRSDEESNAIRLILPSSIYFSVYL